MKTTIGFDVEFFLETEDGKFVHPTFITAGTKDFPICYPSGLKTHPDGASVEFSHTPSTTYEEFEAKLREGFDVLSREGIKALNCPVIYIEDEILETNDSYNESGCSPDFVVIEGKVVERTPLVFEDNYRCAGGHIHFGIGKMDQKQTIFFLDLCEKHLSNWCKIQPWYGEIRPLEQIRNGLYGAKGAHRSKEYGIEYRGLSIAPFMFDPEGLWNQIQTVVELYYKDKVNNTCTVSTESSKDVISKIFADLEMM